MAEPIKTATMTTTIYTMRSNPGGLITMNGTENEMFLTFMNRDDMRDLLGKTLDLEIKFYEHEEQDTVETGLEGDAQ